MSSHATNMCLALSTDAHDVGFCGLLFFFSSQKSLCRFLKAAICIPLENESSTTKIPNRHLKLYSFQNRFKFFKQQTNQTRQQVSYYKIHQYLVGVLTCCHGYLVTAHNVGSGNLIGATSV